MEDNIGERIKERRLAKSMTQAELGHRIGVAKATINKYETGVIKNLKRSTIAQLAQALSTSPGYLMGWTDSPVHVETNNGIIGQNNGLLTVNDCARTLSKEEMELLRIYSVLSVKGRLELIQAAMELEESMVPGDDGQ